MDVDRETVTASLTRSEKWYFPDGNIILQSCDGTLFRIYQGFLSSRSTVFRDMFLLAQPSDSGVASEKIDGCIVVHVSDSALELTHFFMALWDWQSYKYEESNEFEVFAHCLRLSTKYQVDDLRVRAINKLERTYPPTFVEYLQRLDGNPCYFVCTSQAFLVINLVRELDLPATLLPAAFYDCCVGENIGDVLDGHCSESGHTSTLGPQDLRRCLVGYERLVMAERLCNSYLHDDPTSHCTDITGCMLAKVRYIAMLSRRVVGLGPAPLNSLFPPDYAFMLRLCGACIQSGKAQWIMARQKVWDELPETFDLGTWDELMNGSLSP